MGLAWICMKITARIVWRGTYRMMPLSIHLLSHWSIPLKMETSFKILFTICGFYTYESLNRNSGTGLRWRLPINNWSGIGLDANFEPPFKKPNHTVFGLFWFDRTPTLNYFRTLHFYENNLGKLWNKYVQNFKMSPENSALTISTVPLFRYN